MTSRFRLLPAGADFGWTPYGWLVYLGLLGVFLAFLPEVTTTHLVATAVMVIVFLPLYFRGFWLRGPRLLPIVGAIAAIGFVGVFFNPGASVFWVYASGFLGMVGPPRLGIKILLGLVGLIALASALFFLHPGIWIPGIVFSLLIGGVNIHFDEVARKNRALQLAQDEIQQLARTAERERIARDLHDLLGHTLSVIVLKSELASKLGERDPERALAEIREVEAISRQALAEVRRAVYGYRAGTASFGEELENARRALGSAAVEVSYEGPDDPAVAPAAEAVLSLALREAVTNVVRHAEARRCEIRLAIDGAEARLDVIDDGRGELGPEGAGLNGMRERVEALGGRLTRTGGSGTTISVAIPAGTSGAPA